MEQKAKKRPPINKQATVKKVLTPFKQAKIERDERIVKRYRELTGMVTARYNLIAAEENIRPATVQVVVEYARGIRRKKSK